MTQQWRWESFVDDFDVPDFHRVLNSGAMQLLTNPSTVSFLQSDSGLINDEDLMSLRHRDDFRELKKDLAGQSSGPADR